MPKLRDYAPDRPKHNAPMSVDDLRGILGYDPESGQFWWNYNERIGGGHARIGRKAGLRTAYGRYNFITIRHIRYSAHRLAWYLAFGEWPPTGIDHINGNGRDNRIANLRVASHAQNMANYVTQKSISGYRGVTYRAKENRWVAQISVNNRSKYLGIFKDPETAYEAVCVAIREARGEFARVD